MKINSLSSIPKKAFAQPNLWQGQVAGLLHQRLHQHDNQGQHQAPAPCHARVDHVLEVGWAFSGHLCSDESPAEIKAHDGHPREHADGEEVADIAENLADEVWEKLGEVVDDEDVGGGEEDGGNVADDDLAMQVVELRDRAIDNESDKEEEAGDGATDGVDQAQDAGNKNPGESGAGGCKWKVNQVSWTPGVLREKDLQDEGHVICSICNSQGLTGRQKITKSLSQLSDSQTYLLYLSIHVPTGSSRSRCSCVKIFSSFPVKTD